MISKIFVTKTNKKKDAAQGLVEFALVVPILLLVVYGLLEVGRMLFIYSSVVTAARQAVRYGAVTGLGDDGFPLYQDCAGIRAAARKVGFINTFLDSDFDINFDSGPSTAIKETCNGIDYLSTYKAITGDRLVVTISTTFVPIVPLVPLDPITIQSTSSRTILVEIAIESTSDGSGAVDTPTPTNTFTPTATDTPTPTNTPTPTFTPIYSPTASNTPTITFTPTITNTPTITFTPTTTGTATNTPLPTATPIACFVSHDGIDVAQDKMQLNVNNDSDSPITISTITVFYNSSNPTHQALTAIYSDGILVWSGSKSGSPITISDFIDADSALSIEPHQRLSLKLFFAKNIQIDGTEVMSIDFIENGCSEHDTNP